MAPEAIECQLGGNLMLRLSHTQYQITIDNDPSFTFGSIDNPHFYDHAYRLDDERYAPTSLHAVGVTQLDELPIASCILGASRGSSGLHEHSAFIHADTLFFAVGPFVVSLQLPLLSLNWKVMTDQVTCFGVYHAPEHRCLVSHGELEITAVTYEGAIIWSNSGADIFSNGFSTSRDRVIAIDWNEDRYVWDITTGKLIETTINSNGT